ncbi:MAG: hypothetical protein R2843_04955 [Thermomicrobiales bacterium]
MLEELRADDKPVVWALNKIGKIDPEVPEFARALTARLPFAPGALVAPISGASGFNIDLLLSM